MKEILIDFNKCTACKSCEIICSIHHYGIINPKKSRIRVIRNIENGVFYPLIAGPYTDAECSYKIPTIINGKEYNKCSLCRVSCPSRTFFKEPNTNIPIKCDMCGDPPDPQCIKVCQTGALKLIEVEEKNNSESDGKVVKQTLETVF